MLEFSDAPYQFFPSRPSALIIALSQWFNRRIGLPKKHRISEVTVGGATGKVAALAKNGDARLLLVANHPSHSDPQSFTEVQRQLGVTTCCMAAYDVFLRSKFQAWILQRNGAFSIDREDSDRKAMSQAIDILTAGKYGLTIFPEGNVHFTNDRVTPFLDGASFIAVRAQKSLRDSHPVLVVPVALKFTHLTDVRPRVLDSLAELARSVGEKLNPAEVPVDELLRIGRIILVHYLSQHGFISGNEEKEMLGTGSLFETLNRSALQIVTELERKIGLAAKGGDDAQDRIRRIRSTIHQILTDQNREPEHADAHAWATEAILALRILGYGTPYASENPTLDRFAETVEKLLEDHSNKATEEPFGNRAVIARVGDPISVSEALESAKGKTRPAISSLTDSMESSIQSSLDAINASLSTPGSERF